MLGFSQFRDSYIIWIYVNIKLCLDGGACESSQNPWVPQNNTEIRTLYAVLDLGKGKEVHTKKEPCVQ